MDLPAGVESVLATASKLPWNPGIFVRLLEEMDPRNGTHDLVTAMFVAVNSYWEMHQALLRLATYRNGECIECAHKHPNHCHRCGLGAALGCTPHV